MLGIILGVTSNYAYDKIKETTKDSNRRSITNSKLINYFLPNTSAEHERRTIITSKQIDKMKGEVYLLGIAASGYLPIGDGGLSFSSHFISKLIKGDIKLRLILLNPYCQASKIRFAREWNNDIDSIGETVSKKDNYEAKSFYKDISNTLSKVQELKEAGANIDCRLTNFDPIISTMISKDYCYIDILSLGKADEKIIIKKQKSTLPILEFSSESYFYKIAKSHFEYHWKYSITPDEYDYFKPELEKKFFNPSHTGYRLIKQHESWISIDPIVGCLGGCKYCILRTSFQNNAAPLVYTIPEQLSNRLRESKFYHNDAILCLFNYSDAFLSDNKKRIIKWLEALKENNYRNWTCIPTKHPFDSKTISEIKNVYYKEKLIFFVSFSGLPKDIEPSVDIKKIVDSMKILKENNIPIVHYWRPVTELNKSDEDIDKILDIVTKYASCSVISGLKASSSLNKYYKSLNLINGQDEKNQGDYLPKDFLNKLRIKAEKLSYPIYLHASCAVSKITKKPDYNGTMFRSDICALHENGNSICSEDQKLICQTFKNETEKNFDKECYIDTIRDILPGIDVNIDENKIEIKSPIYQEDLINLIHRLKYPITAKKILHTNQYVGSILDS
ncbi:MAG: hypothetical protein GF353_04320 [Candidatus Lokiarchaeota archaeon]|nr:hypothetical protein [Candidatus Lokiarchaeota archaeon]